MRSDESRRVAIVTGGTRGLGLGIARALAADNWDLALCGVRPPAQVGEILELLRREGGTVEYWAADVGSRAARTRLVVEAFERFGTIHALVNNAGRAPRVRADLLEASEDSFEEIVRINLQGPYFLTQEVARRFVKQKALDPHSRTCVVFVTSISADMVSINRGEYCITKAGLAMAARLFAVRLASHGIPVYEVRPGIMATDMTASVKDAYDQRIAAGLVPDARWGEPDDVGRAVTALLRGDIPYATGTVIHVDGGLSIPRL
jgi:3-oxoacyl-[acyl-carrier protein] reductase